MRPNTHEVSPGRITIDPVRADAFEALAAYYAAVFAEGRDAYAIPRGALTDPLKGRDMSAFFWWTAWAATTNRPGQSVTYTNNWPHEPLVGNRPTGSAVVWSVISFVLLLAGIGGMVWYFAAQERPSTPAEVPSRDPLLGLQPTPSQRATAKYFYLTAALIVVQVGLGVITAHYGVEGSGFYDLPLDRWLPSAVTRTWHTHVVLALGPTFSALEVVPLVLIGFEAWENVRLARARSWRSAYRWPMAFFVGGPVGTSSGRGCAAS